jgi:hypothetical protein
MKCIYVANELLEMKIDGKLVVINNGDIVDIPFIPNDKVKMLFPYEEPKVEEPVKKSIFSPTKSTKKSTKKKKR